MPWLELVAAVAFGLSMLTMLVLVVLGKGMVRPSVPGADERPATRTAIAVVALIAFTSLSVLLMALPGQSIWEAHAQERWPVVTATVTSAQVVLTHVPAHGKSRPWTGWCLNVGYAYDWRGTRYEGSFNDSTPGPLVPVCFIYKEAAEHAALRHKEGDLVAVRVDPEHPARSTGSPPGIHGGDVVAVIGGSLPLVLPVATGLYYRRRRRNWAGARAHGG